MTPDPLTALNTAAEARHEAWRKIAGLALNARDARTGSPDSSAPGVQVHPDGPNFTVTYRTGLQAYSALMEPSEHRYTQQEREALVYVASVELTPLWQAARK